MGVAEHAEAEVEVLDLAAVDDAVLETGAGRRAPPTPASPAATAPPAAAEIGAGPGNASPSPAPSTTSPPGAASPTRAWVRWRSAASWA